MSESVEIAWSVPRIGYNCEVCDFITELAKNAVAHVQKTGHPVEKMVCETLTLAKAGA